MPRKKLRDRSREMRNAPSDAEYRLWYFLRGRQLRGVKFRRQVPIGSFIVDFAALERKLVIELDGGQHGERRSYDDARTRWLNAQGFRVMRFWNHEVLEETDAIVEMIANALQEREIVGGERKDDGRDAHAD